MVEERGKTTGVRVLDANGKAEVSFQASGTLLGIESTDVVTYQAVPRPDGTLWGEGQGVATTKDGEFATWWGHGIGKPTGKGWGARWRGAIYFQTQSKKLQRLNEVAGVFEYEADENGNTHGKVWEWK